MPILLKTSNNTRDIFEALDEWERRQVMAVEARELPWAGGSGKRLQRAGSACTAFQQVEERRVFRSREGGEQRCDHRERGGRVVRRRTAA